MSMKDSDVSRTSVVNIKLEYKKLTKVIQEMAGKYDKLVELYEACEGGEGASYPGFPELSDILDILKDGGFVKNSKYWTDHDQWEREREYPEGTVRSNPTC